MSPPAQKSNRCKHNRRQLGLDLACALRCLDAGQAVTEAKIEGHPLGGSFFCFRLMSALAIWAAPFVCPRVRIRGVGEPIAEVG